MRTCDYVVSAIVYSHDATAPTFPSVVAYRKGSAYPNFKFVLSAKTAQDALVQAQVGLNALFEDGKILNYNIMGLEPY